MSYEKEREIVKTLYKWRSWASKVDKMSDDQAIAIYMKMKAEGKIT